MLNFHMLTLYNYVVSRSLNWFIYNGEGVAENARDRLRRLLESLGQKVQTITAKEVEEGSWRKEAQVFVIPGGQSRIFGHHLQGKANDNLRAFVADGGNYLGICGGAYYASRLSQFNFSSLYAQEHKECTESAIKEKSTPIEREMFFFHGQSSGPFTSDDDVLLAVQEAANLPFDKFVCPIRGGGLLSEDQVVPKPCSKAQVLARFPTGDAAIVSGSYGHGLYLLSGPHVEFIEGLDALEMRVKSGVSDDDLFSSDPGRQYTFFITMFLLPFINSCVRKASHKATHTT